MKSHYFLGGRVERRAVCVCSSNSSGSGALVYWVILSSLVCIDVKVGRIVMARHMVNKYNTTLVADETDGRGESLC